MSYLVKVIYFNTKSAFTDLRSYLSLCGDRDLLLRLSLLPSEPYWYRGLRERDRVPRFPLRSSNPRLRGGL